MKSASKHLLSRGALALLTLLCGAPSSSLLANDALPGGSGGGRTASFGNDGVGGIEKTAKPGNPADHNQAGTRTSTPIAPATSDVAGGQGDGAWLDLGSGLGVGSVQPKLGGNGSGTPGTLVMLTLNDARPGASAALIIGLTAANAPFKGGTLVPTPMLIVTGLPVNLQGSLALPAMLPATLPSGLALTMQMWMPEVAAPKGFTASNGLQLQVP
jgi:hypothetical protein